MGDTTTTTTTIDVARSRGQEDKAPEYGSGDRRFDSYREHRKTFLSDYALNQNVY